MNYVLTEDLEKVYDSLLEPYSVDDTGYEVHYRVTGELKQVILDRIAPFFFRRNGANLYLMWYYDTEKMFATVEFGYGPGEVDLTFVHGFNTDETLSTSLLYWLAGLR